MKGHSVTELKSKALSEYAVQSLNQARKGLVKKSFFKRTKSLPTCLCQGYTAYLYCITAADMITHSLKSGNPLYKGLLTVNLFFLKPGQVDTNATPLFH